VALLYLFAWLGGWYQWEYRVEVGGSLLAIRGGEAMMRFAVGDHPDF
jgi:hypothetical protein